MFEGRTQKLLPLPAFYRRVVAYALVALGIIGASLLLGMVGYHEIGGMSWIDSFLNAAMIMGGMGQVGEVYTDAAKVFAGVYALYCGVIFLISVGVLLAPAVHRFMHRFHLDIEAEAAKGKKQR